MTGDETARVLKIVGDIGVSATIKERQRCHDIALAIDSGRGNEKEIARAIMEGK